MTSQLIAIDEPTRCERVLAGLGYELHRKRRASEEATVAEHEANGRDWPLVDDGNIRGTALSDVVSETSHSVDGPRLELSEEDHV